MATLLHFELYYIKLTVNMQTKIKGGIINLITTARDKFCFIVEGIL